VYNTWSPRIPRGPFRPLRTVKPSRTRRPRWSSASVYTCASLWPSGAWREAGTDTDMDRHIVTDITDTNRPTDNKKRAHTRTGCPFPGCMYAVQVCESLQHMSAALPCLCVRVFSCRCRLHEGSSADSKPKVPHTLHSAQCNLCGTRTYKARTHHMPASLHAILRIRGIRESVIRRGEKRKKVSYQEDRAAPASWTVLRSPRPLAARGVPGSSRGQEGNS
jgi:hypothetical protein